jgi:uncharacterized protein YciI
MTRSQSLEPALYAVLHYDYVTDMVERRAPFRDDHLAYVQNAKERNELVNAGAFDGGQGALLVFAPDMEQAATKFAADDPYMAAQLITSWRVGTWNVVA